MRESPWTWHCHRHEELILQINSSPTQRTSCLCVSSLGSDDWARADSEGEPPADFQFAGGDGEKQRSSQAQETASSSTSSPSSTPTPNQDSHFCTSFTGTSFYSRSQAELHNSVKERGRQLLWTGSFLLAFNRVMLMGPESSTVFVCDIDSDCVPPQLQARSFSSPPERFMLDSLDSLGPAPFAPTSVLLNKTIHCI